VDNTVTKRPSGVAGGATTGDRSTLLSANEADSSTGNTQSDPPLRGSDLARAALEAARKAADSKRVGRRGRGVPRGTSTGSRRRRRWSGAGADDRDPQPLGRLASRIAVDRGWNENLAGGQVFGRWAALVGSEVAQHATPVALKDGELTVAAESTAWATQLRLLQRQLLGQIAAGVGKGVVKKLKVQGPMAPSWRYGPRHVSGRGPRDTYG
jgi:predicted nucleic acid-binding Zn ribbon protein